jgi:hypothetical protein
MKFFLFENIYNKNLPFVLCPHLKFFSPGPGGGKGVNIIPNSAGDENTSLYFNIANSAPENTETEVVNV